METKWGTKWRQELEISEKIDEVITRTMRLEESLGEAASRLSVRYNFGTDKEESDDMKGSVEMDEIDEMCLVS